jgi:phosphonatase-like hydrolase
VREIELVVFDMAGTTIEDRGQVIHAFKAALRKAGVVVTGKELQAWRGAAKREVLRFYLEQRYGRDDADVAPQVERAYAEFRLLLESSYVEGGVRAVAGAEATFAWLRDRGIKIGLTTGFYRKVTDIMLQAVGWHQGIIDACICSDGVPQGRPAPFMIFRAMEATGVTSVHRVIKVGDTARDLLAGRNAGVRGVVGVLSGSHGIERLGRVYHTHIITSVAELPQLWESPMEWDSPIE